MSSFDHELVKQPTHFSLYCAIEMTSIIQQRITSFYLFILIIFLLINQPVFSNKIVDLINTIRTKNTDDNRSKDNLGTTFFFLLYISIVLFL
jgi:hypothetical protein